MEGLIPYLLHALKKEKPRNSYRSFSENSTSHRSYHRLLSESSHNFPDGSSHRRTRSEFQPPPSLDFADHQQQQRSRSIGRGFLPSPSENRKNQGSSYSDFRTSNFDNGSSAVIRRKIYSK